VVRDTSASGIAVIFGANLLVDSTVTGAQTLQGVQVTDGSLVLRNTVVGGAVSIYIYGPKPVATGGNRTDPAMTVFTSGATRLQVECDLEVATVNCP
jgi:hypothetical protein